MSFLGAKKVKAKGILKGALLVDCWGAALPFPFLEAILTWWGRWGPVDDEGSVKEVTDWAAD